MKKILKIVGIAFVVLILLGVIGSILGGGDDEEPADDNQVVENGSATPVTDNTPEEPEVDTWKEGMFKVGVDIPAGEYVLLTDSMGYLEVASDSTGKFESILSNENFANNAIVVVKDGQYLKFDRATAYRLGEEPTLDTTLEGMFKVGVHIQAGEYKVINDGSCYIEVSSDASHTLDAIISNDNLNGDGYITVKDGQYLTLSRCHLQ